MSKGALSDEQITLTFVSKVWLYESTAVAVMNFDSCESTQYEIELALKKHERPDQQAVRETSKWCPNRMSKRTSNGYPFETLYTENGTPILMLEHGFGLVVSLKAS